MGTRDSDRKSRLADAAIEVVGAEGLRGLTHRAVDVQAGLPSGTCSYHFPTRQTLISALLHRIAELDRADIAEAWQGRTLAELDPATLIEASTKVLARWLGPDRARCRTRLLLMLDPQSRQVAAPLGEAYSADFRTEATGFAGGHDRGGFLMAIMDGLVVDELTRGTIPVDVDRLRARLTSVVALVSGHRG